MSGLTIGVLALTHLACIGGGLVAGLCWLFRRRDAWEQGYLEGWDTRKLCEAERSRRRAGRGIARKYRLYPDRTLGEEGGGECRN